MKKELSIFDDVVAAYGCFKIFHRWSPWELVWDDVWYYRRTCSRCDREGHAQVIKV